MESDFSSLALQLMFYITMYMGTENLDKLDTALDEVLR
jgi:hypothetical protein